MTDYSGLLFGRTLVRFCNGHGHARDTSDVVASPFDVKMLRLSTLGCKMRFQGFNGAPCCLVLDVAENKSALPASTNAALTSREQVIGDGSADRVGLEE